MLSECNRVKPKMKTQQTPDSERLQELESEVTKLKSDIEERERKQKEGFMLLMFMFLSVGIYKIIENLS